MATKARRKGRLNSGPHKAAHLSNPDYPYTMKLGDGRTVYVEVPGRWVRTDRDGQPAFMSEAVQFLDRVRALSMKMPGAPSPGFIASLREALGLTQVEFAERLNVAPMTVSRWERGTVRPSAAALETIEQVKRDAVRHGVAIPQ